MNKILKHRNKVLSSRFLIFIPEKNVSRRTHTPAQDRRAVKPPGCAVFSAADGAARRPLKTNTPRSRCERGGSCAGRVCVTATGRKALWISVSVFSRRVPYRRSYRSVRLYRYRARGRRIPDLRFRCRRAWHLSVSLRLRRVLS